MKKFSIRFIASLLSVLLVVMSLPVSAFAIVLSSDSSPPAEDEINHNRDIVEIIDMRTATDKYFRLDDGSYYVAHYNSDIHYLDDNGVWQDIDNSLAVNGSEITTSNAKIKLAKKTTGNGEIFTIHDGNRKLSLALNGANKKIDGIITNNETEFDDDTTQLQKMTTLDKISASVRYNDILENVDLEYIIKGANIKENIIVKERSSNYSYSFTLSLNNLVATLNERNEVIISDSSTSEVVYFIPTPIMWDANGVYSDDIAVTLTDNNNGKYTLTLTADSDWMNATERAYPITIDPPIYTSSSSSVLDLDFTTTSSSPSVSSTSLYVSSTWRAYWKLTTLPTLPASAYITNAEFTLECFTSDVLQGYVAVYDVLSDWDDTLIYSKTTATTGHEGKPTEHFSDFQEIYTEDYDGTGEYCLNDYWGYHWNVTPIVKKWYAGENYGLMLAPATGTTFTGIAKFYSNDHTVAAEIPQLCIEYRDMKGVEDYWTFSSQSAGFAGTGSVNNATGNLVFSIPTLTTTDALMPITPAMVYNSALAGKDYSYSNIQTSNVISLAPKGFKLNLHETLIKKSYIDAEGATAYYFIWADADGTEHYFMPTETSRTYSDEDGLLLTLVEGTTCTITDSDANVRTFTSRSRPSGTISGWYLSSIADKNGNQVTFEVDSSYRPITINLVPKSRTAIEQMKIAYNSDGDPYVVWNPNSGEGVVFRMSAYATTTSTITSGGSYLRQTIRAHGGTTEAEWLAFYNTNSNTSTSTIRVDAVAQYTYNSSGLLLTATNNLLLYEISYGYNSAKRVTSVAEYTTATNGLGQQISLSYGTSSTVIRTSGTDDVFNTSDDLITTYGFDYAGRTVSCYTTDLDRTQIYGTSNGQYVGEENENAKNNLKSSVQTTQQSSNYLLNGDFEETSSSSMPYWTKVGTVTNSSAMSYADYSCATFTVNSSITSSSIYQYVYLDKGEYSLSMNINTDESQNVSVYLKAESMSNSSHSVIQEIPVNEYYATGSYAFASLNFKADPSTSSGTERFKITILVTGSPSSNEQVWVDNVMLSKTTGSAEYDTVHMGHFESSNSSYSPEDFWTILDNEETPITIVDSEIPAFGDVLHIDIDLDQYEFVEQTVYQLSNELIAQYDAEMLSYRSDPILYTVSGWGKGTGQSYTETSLFGISVCVYYHDGSTYGTSESFDFDFDKGITDWQFISGGFTTNPDKGLVKKITITLMYNDHSGDGYFDNISLVRDSSTSDFYEYKSSGYLSSYQNGSNTTWYQYDDNNNVIKAISSNKTNVEYEYDSSNRVTKEYHSRYTGFFNPSSGTVTGDVTELYYHSYSYNSFGQQYYTWTYDSSDESKQSCSITEYNTANGSHIFGTVANEIDTLWNMTSYFYDENTGRLLATIYPEGNGVSYQYDVAGNLTIVLPVEINSTSDGYIENTSSAYVTYGYDETTNRLDSITTKPTSTTSTTYTFEYDGFGNTTGIDVGSRNLADYSYNSYNGKLNVLTYGNGHKVKYIYDVLDRVSKVQYNTGANGAFETVYSYTYDSAGNIYSVTDHTSDEVTLYKYDAAGKLMDSYVYDRNTYLNLYGTTIYYDEESRIDMVFHSFDYAYASGTTYDHAYYSYVYSTANGNIEKLRYSGDYISGSIDPVYDNFGRASTKTIDFNINSADAFFNKLTYDYVTDGSYESAWVSQVVSEIRKGSSTSLLSTTTWNYSYDENGNITQIADASGVIQYQYQYDDLGQLVREDNRALGLTYIYYYDNAGNITGRAKYLFTTGALGTIQNFFSYTYGDSNWGDLLTNYYGYTSEAITYDNIGNPLTIGEQELSWEGRQLTSWYDGEYIAIDYGYNADGIRTFKEVYDADTGETTRHEYILSGSQIIRETVFVDGVESYTLVYLYDEAGAPLGYRYRTPSYANGVFDGYFFEKNLQGDIIAVYNQSGTKLVKYTYDAWGSTTSTYLNGVGSTAARLNPFRYRGYYFDSETGFYYLQSRYYNPTWGRFISADESSYLGVGNAILSYNLFAYCANNPIMYVDPTGTFSWGKLAAITAVTAVIAVSVVATVATFGAASVAGTIAITSAITIAAKATEVAVLQGKKSTQDGDSTVEVIDDMVNTAFDYGGDIIGLTPITKAAGFGSGFYSQSAPFQDSLELMKLDGSLRGLPSSAAGEFVNRFKNAKEFLSMTTSKSSFIISYGFAAIAAGNTIYSCFTSDPVARAESLGYALK